MFFFIYMNFSLFISQVFIDHSSYKEFYKLPQILGLLNLKSHKGLHGSCFVGYTEHLQLIHRVRGSPKLHPEIMEC